MREQQLYVYLIVIFISPQRIVEEDKMIFPYKHLNIEIFRIKIFQRCQIFVSTIKQRNRYMARFGQGIGQKEFRFLKFFFICNLFSNVEPEREERIREEWQRPWP